MDQAITTLTQLAPGAGIETILLSVSSTEKALISQIAVCNRSAAASLFRLSISLLGVPTTVKDYLYYDLPVNGNDTFAIELGVTLNANDVMRVFCGSAYLALLVFGAQA